MHPILFRIGSWPVYSYGVLLAAAYLVALQLAVSRSRRAGLDPARVMDLGIYLIIPALVGAVLLFTERRGRPFAGRTFWLYMLLYAVSRFIIEIYRGDERGVILGVSTSQFVSLVIVPLSLFMLWRLSRRAV